MTQSDLQKIIVLCVLIASIIVIGWFLAQAPGKHDARTQIDPPSLEIEPAPVEVDGNEYPEDEPGPPSTGGESLPEQNPVACTMDAKMCPDGSFVGRTGPDCAFAECPTATGSQTQYCAAGPDSIDACTDIYAPVCGLVEVQCITTPCDPVPQTFSNTCQACAQSNLISYTEGACAE